MRFFFTKSGLPVVKVKNEGMVNANSAFLVFRGMMLN